MTLAIAVRQPGEGDNSRAPDLSRVIFSGGLNIDMAAKRHKKHKNKIPGPLISAVYNK
jgi:hypothetical protein